MGDVQGAIVSEAGLICTEPCILSQGILLVVKSMDSKSLLVESWSFLVTIQDTGCSGKESEMCTERSELRHVVLCVLGNSAHFSVPQFPQL